MQLLRFSMESCIRNKKKAILNLMICMVIVILVNVFAGNIISIKEQMKKLPEAISIRAIVSNLNGSMDSGLKIKEEQVDKILASTYTENVTLAVQLKVGFGEFGVEDYLGNLNYFATGCNRVAGIPGMKEEDIKLASGTSTQDFFQSTDRICVIDERVMQERELTVGEQITLTSFYYRFGKEDHSIYIDPFETGAYTIVGTMNIMDFYGEGVQPDILVPFETVRNIYHEKDIEFFADSVSFTVKDPYKLNELKQEMHDMGFLPVSFQSEFQYDGNALVIKDDTFISSAEQLIKSRNLLMGALPFVGVAVLCIGFVMAELLMKGRISEYAIMRSLGQSHKESFLMLVLEYGLSALIGSAIGVVIGIVGLKTGMATATISAATFFVCYMIGTMAALSSLKKLSVMSVLSKND